MTVRQNGWSARLDDKDDNAFDAIRLLLAILVLFEHSFFLIENGYTQEPLFHLTGGQINSGAFAVYMFFAISGFLVTRSYVMTGGLLRYLAKRLARIAPGFLVASALALTVLAPLTALSVAGFFVSQNWLRMLALVLTLHQANPDGILTGNPVQLIHGTLWTIKYEFDCYLLVALLGLLGMLAPRRAWIAYGAILGALCASRAGLFGFPDINYGPVARLISDPVQWPFLFPYFFVGSALYVFRAYIPKSAPLAIAALVLLAVSALTGGFYWLLLTAGVYALTYLALSVSADLKLFGRRIDLSYGVYLYGWPVAQLVLFFDPSRPGPYMLFVLTLPLTLLAAAASWYLVEYPSLRLVKGRKA